MDAQINTELESNSDEQLLVLLKLKLKNIKGWLLAPPRDIVAQIYAYSSRKIHVRYN
jgi:hypothetical protein